MKILALALVAVSAQAATIVNPGFETGDFTGWTPLAFYNAAGPASGAPNYSTFVASQTGSVPAVPNDNAVVTSVNSTFDGTVAGGGAVLPASGSYFGFLSNYNSLGDACLGASCVTGSSISQSIALPSNAAFLNLYADFLTNDGVVGGVGANDFGGIALLQGSTLLAQYNLDGDSTSSANAHATIGLAAGNFSSSTGWQPLSFDLSAYGGQTITVVAYVNQGAETPPGPAGGESRLLLDANPSNALTVSPEPSTFVLLGAGLLILVASRLRRFRLDSRTLTPLAVLAALVCVTPAAKAQFTSGIVQVNFTYNGAAPSTLNTTNEVSNNSCGYLPAIDSPYAGFGGFYNSPASCDSVTSGGISVGTHTLNIVSTNYTGVLFLTKQITVSGGQTNVVNVELGGVFGTVSGNVTVNGQVPASQTTQVHLSNTASNDRPSGYTDPSNGSFRFFIPSGPGTGSVTQGNVLGTFTFNVVPGQDNPVGQTLGQPQTITFGALANQLLSVGSITVSATASSGLPVTFGSGTPGVCSVSGSTVTLFSGGVCSITASQSGSNTYQAAPQVTRTFTVTGSQTITFPNPGLQVFGTTPTLGATASSGLTVTYTSTTPAVCSVSGATLSFTTAGPCTIRADQAGNAYVTAAPSVSQTFTVGLGAALTGVNKTYDGTNTATVTCAPLGVTAADNGNVTCAVGSAAFVAPFAGNGVVIVVGSVTLGGNAAGHYTLGTTTGTASANIAPKPVTPSVTAANKLSDGTTSATITACSLTGVIAADVGSVFCVPGSATFASAGPGNGITVTATGITLSGGEAGNYSLSSTSATTTANITPVTTTVTPTITASNKTYDGTVAASVTCALTGVLAADAANVSCSAASASFATPGAANGITVTATGITLGGSAASKYSLSATSATTTANITKKSVTPSVTASNKIADGTTGAIVVCSLTGVLAADAANVTCSAASSNFASPNIGNNITVTATGITLAGSGAGNYSLSATSATTTANITGVPVSIATVPSGLSISVDGTAHYTPTTLYLSQGAHTLTADATQQGTSTTRYNFQSWSAGVSNSGGITVGGTPASYTATYQTQYQLTTSATLGGTISPATAFFDAGTVVPVSASASAGNSFTGFSGDLTGTTTPQNITMSAPHSVVANFKTTSPSGNVTIASVPSGQQVLVDGAYVTTPYKASWTVGSLHNLSAPATIAGVGTQYVFGSWSQGGAATQNMVVPTGTTTYTANFTTQYQLTTSVTGAGTISPSGGWYNAGASVSMKAAASSGSTFGGWGGALSGTTNPQSVVLNAPTNVTATFNTTGSLTLYTISKSNGTLVNERDWTLTLLNPGSALTNVQITGVSIAVTGSATVTRSANTPLPVAVGNIAGGGGTSAPFNFDLIFPATTPASRATVTLTYTASGGVTGTVAVTSTR